MELEEFVEEVSKAAEKFDWIKDLKIERITEIRVWIRLFLNDNFVETFITLKLEARPMPTSRREKGFSLQTTCE